MKIDYYAYRSKMRKWNTEFKIWLSCLSICFAICLDHRLLSIMVFLVMSLFVVVVGKLPMKIYISYLSIPLLFMLTSSFMIAFDFSKASIGDWNLDLKIFYLCVTKESIHQAIDVFLKGISSVSALYMLVFSTPMANLIFSMQKMHVPKIMIELMHLIYRYIFLLLDLAREMMIAAKARLGYRNYKISLRTFSYIASNLFIVAMKKGNIYYDAMIARGYNGTFDILIDEYPIKRIQIIAAMFYFLCLIGIGLLG